MQSMDYAASVDCAAGHSLGKCLPSAEMQSVYFTPPPRAKWANAHHVIIFHRTGALCGEMVNRIGLLTIHWEPRSHPGPHTLNLTLNKTKTKLYKMVRLQFSRSGKCRVILYGLFLHYPNTHTHTYTDQKTCIYIYVYMYQYIKRGQLKTLSSMITLARNWLLAALLNLRQCSRNLNIYVLSMILYIFHL